MLILKKNIQFSQKIYSNNLLLQWLNRSLDILSIDILIYLDVFMYKCVHIVGIRAALIHLGIFVAVPTGFLVYCQILIEPIQTDPPRHSSHFALRVSAFIRPRPSSPHQNQLHNIDFAHTKHGLHRPGAHSYRSALGVAFKIRNFPHLHVPYFHSQAPYAYTNTINLYKVVGKLYPCDVCSACKRRT